MKTNGRITYVNLLPVWFGHWVSVQRLLSGVRDMIPLVLRLAAYHEKWVRDPESIHCESSLIDQLLGLYPVPMHFNRAWLAPGNLVTPERDAYCHVAQGGSARELPELVGRLSKRAAHLLVSTQPGGLSLREVMRWSQATALGAPDWMARFFAESRMTREYANYPIWQQLMEMVVAGQVPRWQLGIVVDHLAQKLHSQWPEEVSLKGVSLEDLVREAENAFAQLRKIALEQGLEVSRKSLASPVVRDRLLGLARQSWKPMKKMKLFRREIDGVTWEIVELCSQYQLDQESRKMHHCVETYAFYCLQCDSAIFSLRSPEGPVLTIEVDRVCRYISEVRGKWNRTVNDREIPVLRAWVEENRLDWDQE